MKIVTTVLSALYGLMMANSGLNKFLWYMPEPKLPEGAVNLFIAYSESGWMLPLIAIAEIIGGALIIIPKTRALGAIVLLPIVVGIFLFHLVLDPGTVAMSIVLLAVNVFVIIQNREKYMPMIG